MTQSPITHRISRLAWIQRWVTPHKNVIDIFLSLVFIQFTIAGLGFLTRVKIAGILGKEAFGDMAFAVAIGTFGMMFIQFGFDKSLVRELVHLPERFGELLKVSLMVRIGLLTIFLVVLATFGFYVRPIPEDSWGMLFIILATIMAAFQIQAVYDAWKEMRRHAIYLLLERCVYFALVWIFILNPFLSLSLTKIGIFMIVSVAIGLLLQYSWALPRVDFSPTNSLGRSTTYVIQSNLWIWLAVLAGLSIDTMTQIMLKCYAGSEQLGGYSAAWLIVRLAMLVLSQFARIGSEKIARYTRPEMCVSTQMHFLVRYVVMMGIMGICLGLPCILLPGKLLNAFGPEYASSASTLRILGFYPIIFGPYLAILQYVIASRLQKTYFVLISFVGLTSMGLGFSLIPNMQAIGAAFTVVLSLSLAFILFMIVTLIHLKNAKIVPSASIL